VLGVEAHAFCGGIGTNHDRVGAIRGLLVQLNAPVPGGTLERLGEGHPGRALTADQGDEGPIGHGSSVTGAPRAVCDAAHWGWTGAATE
jgi:hypothetical protein